MPSRSSSSHNGQLGQPAGGEAANQRAGRERSGQVFVNSGTIFEAQKSGWADAGVLLIFVGPSRLSGFSTAARSHIVI